MRVSEYYNLGRTQPTLDFVDVDIIGDTRVFIDPRALRLLPSAWGDECVSLIQNFFRTILVAIHEGRHEDARRLLRVLREPNETHLGWSQTKARGHGLGPQSAKDVWQALSRSQAVKSGLLEDLEDTILMIDDIGPDIISDISTNIIREPLIRYTQDMAALYGLPLVPQVNSGPLWDPGRQEWDAELVRMPITSAGKLLLVPKVIVRQGMEYDAEEYYRYYILENLREVELGSNSELVKLLKDGTPRVTIKDLKKKYGRGKSLIVEETRKHPELLNQYRDDKRASPQPPLDHLEIASSEGTAPPDWDRLLSAVINIPSGREHFSEYEKAIESLLTTLFYPSLSNPQLQRDIHEGRKRIDLTYTNVATSGFFQWLGQHFSAPHIFIECKNYAGDPGNPELDQLSGRFSPSRGQVGIQVCRNFLNTELFLKRCRDTALDHRGYILPLDDGDLVQLVRERQKSFHRPEFSLLKERFDSLIM